MSKEEGLIGLVDLQDLRLLVAKNDEEDGFEVIELNDDLLLAK